MASTHACLSCKHGKRKCDKQRPSCSACGRIRRKCMYQEDEIAWPSNASAGGNAFAQASFAFQQEIPGPPTSPYLGLPGDFGLEKAEVDLRVRTETLRSLGSMPGLHAIAGVYFNSVHQRVTIVSKKRFLERLPTFATSAGADIAALCLSMNLVIQQPDSHRDGKYVQLKRVISLLEASGHYQSLEVVQCRLLCAFYEPGHGIHPAVSVSLGACSRVSRFLRLNIRPSHAPEVRSNSVEEEERRRVWWTLMNLDRFIGLSFSDHSLCTQDSRIDEFLPIDDLLWLQDVIPAPTASDANMTTSYDIRLGQLARECQVSHLSGRVLRHCFDPTSDPVFQEQEASQLERTLLALMPVLVEQEIQFGRYCSSLGICSNALYLLYAHAKDATPDDVDQQNLTAMEPLSTQIADFSRRLFGNPEELDHSIFTPYIPLSLYQSAVVQLRLWKRTRDPVYEERLISLKEILGHFNRRWLIAGFYLRALEQDSPALLLDGIPMA